MKVEIGKIRAQFWDENVESDASECGDREGGEKVARRAGDPSTTKLGGCH